MRLLLRLVVLAAAFVFPLGSAHAAELTQATLKAFEDYVRDTEERIRAEHATGDKFLITGTLSQQERDAALAQMKRGEVFVRKMLRGDGDLEDGMIHHWAGAVFIPGTTVDKALALVQDYDNHSKTYAPDVERSKLVQRKGNEFESFLRFRQKRVITVVLNTNHRARYTRISPQRWVSESKSTRIAEVEEPGTPSEKEKPVGNDTGFLWRLYTYWRFMEADGGVYVQCEAVSLSRDIPGGPLKFIIRPFVTGVPRESLQHTLLSTRKALAK
jgi:hypothetical protein